MSITFGSSRPVLGFLLSLIIMALYPVYFVGFVLADIWGINVWAFYGGLFFVNILLRQFLRDITGALP